MPGTAERQKAGVAVFISDRVTPDQRKEQGKEDHCIMKRDQFSETSQQPFARTQEQSTKPREAKTGRAARRDTDPLSRSETPTPLSEVHIQEAENQYGHHQTRRHHQSTGHK